MGQLDLDLQVKAEQRLRSMLDTSLEKAIDDLDPKRLMLTWNVLYELMEQARQLGFVDLQFFQKALCCQKELNLSFDDVMDLEKRDMDQIAKLFFSRLFKYCRDEDFDQEMGLRKIEVERVVQVRH